MKAFKKAALAAAVAALPMTGFAMEALQDEALSEVTGQDGITITLGSTGAFDIFIGDADGDAQNTPNRLTGLAGGIYIDGFDTGAGNTVIEIDADVDTIQAGITLGAGTIDLGAISPSDGSGPGTTVLDMGTLTHTGITINVQLGAEDQGNFAVLTGMVTGGINLNNFSINDTNSTGAISMDLLVNDAGAGTDLTLSGNVNVTTGGITIENLPSVDVSLNNLNVGGTGDIGDVSIIGLTTPNITIAGH
jgi:hypothetical protein